MTVRPKRPGPRAGLRKIYDRLYDANGRQHWWPGDTRFEIMVGAVLTQNTAWVNVERAIANLRRARALNPGAIVRARPQRLAGWLRPSGYFNVKARRLKAFCRWLIAQGGAGKLARMPTDELRHALLAVHGVGPETADDILLYAFHRPVFVVDAYTRRIFTRLGHLKGDESYETIRELFERRLGPDVPLFNEYHALIVAHGKDTCRPKPRCGRCVLASCCPSANT
jgi:endonuclease-3 related protein